MMTRALAVGMAAAVWFGAQPAGPVPPVAFELVQPELFSASGGQPNAWTDVDGDGDLDLFVGFRGRPNRLYRQTDGRFADVAATVGLADAVETRAAAWGDYDADGDPDLYVGFRDGGASREDLPHRGQGTRFVDVAQELGVSVSGVSRQPAWIDYDGDGDLDLFLAVSRSGQPSVPQRRPDIQRRHQATGLGDARKSVGALWWDFDRDGDLDVFVANQEGDANGLFQNDGGRFTDVASDIGVSAAGRAADLGGVGPSLGDFDLDGDFDLFVANYGPSALYRQGPDRRFTDVARAAGITFEGHATTSAVGDIDGDGRLDLYLGAFLAPEPHYRDWLYLNRTSTDGMQFVEALPADLRTHDASHGVQLVDFDRDGRLDLSLTNNDASGEHALLRNVTRAAGRGVNVIVVDDRGRLTRAGAELRVFRAGTTTLVAAAIVDSGSGYCSQNAGPVHIGLAADVARVDVEVTMPLAGRRVVTRLTSVDPAAHSRQPLVIRTPAK